MIFILQLVSSLLMIFLLMSMMAKARPFRKLQVPGKPLHRLPVGFQSKLLIHRSSLMALLTGGVFGVLGGWLPLSMVQMFALFAVAILIFPMNYTLTTKGVAVGNALFHSWSDFSGVSAASKSSLKLARPNSFGRLTLSVKPAEMPNVLKFIERHIEVPSTNS
jgi:hypothetical protein